MSLPDLHVRLLPQSPILTPWPPTGAQILDALYTLLTSTTYRDGSARTPGVGSAVKNVVKVQELGVTVAIYGEFATTTAINAKWIYASRSTVPAPAPVLFTGEVFQDNEVYVGLVKNATGVFTSWHDSPPFVGSEFVGYSRWTGAGSAATNPLTSRVSQIDALETEEWLLVGGVGQQSNVAFTGQYFFTFTGALWAPFPTTLGETDDRLWGVATSPGESPDIGTETAVSVFPNGVTAAGLSARVFAYDVGLATATTLVRENVVRGNSLQRPMFLDQSGHGLARNDLYMKNATGGAFRGTMRNVSIIEEARGNGQLVGIYDSGSSLVAIGLLLTGGTASDGMLWMGA